MGLGPPVAGYCILITEKHLPSYGALDHSQVNELQAVLQAIQAAQVTAFGDSLFFEHGRNGGCLPYSGDEDLCYHAHLHILPAAVDLLSAVQVDYQTAKLTGFHTLSDITQSGIIPYLLIQDNDKLAYIADPQSLPGRYLRTKVLQLLGEDTAFADWQAFPRYDVVRQGARALQETLTGTWQSTSFAAMYSE